MIRTEGTSARGVRAGHDGLLGRAEAENEGAITTTGGRGGSWPSYGLHAITIKVPAHAVNHEGATIVTEGDAASGMIARSYGGTAATATNRGSITTHGDGEDVGDHGSVA